jgi:hypothetical protein
MDSLTHKDLSPQSMRHTCAVPLLRSGVDLTMIKAWLGRSDTETTARYIDLDLDKKREALEKFLKLNVERLVGNARAGSPYPTRSAPELARGDLNGWLLTPQGIAGAECYVYLTPCPRT